MTAGIVGGWRVGGRRDAGATAGCTSQTGSGRVETITLVTAEVLVRTVEDFLTGSRDAVVIENGAVAFDLASAKFAVLGEHNKCVLHLWSAERNVVRRLLEAEVRNEVLRLAVQRLGQAKPIKLEICRERDRRTPTARKAARTAFSKSCSECWSGAFLGSKWLNSPRPWIWNGRLVRSTRGV